MNTPTAEATPEAAPFEWRETDAILLTALLSTALHAVAGLLALAGLFVLVVDTLEPQPEQPLAVKITFFDGTNSARYEVRDPADFDGATLAEVHRRFYGSAVRANAAIREEE